MQITKTFEWDMGHRIPNHKSKCRNLHGHRYKIEVVLEGVIIQKKGSSAEGMLMDFSDIKAVLLEEIDQVCDHAFMVYEKDEEVMEFFKKNSSFAHIVVPFVPTVEEISRWIFEKLDKRYSDTYGTNIVLSLVKIWETPTSTAIFSREDYKNK